MSKLFIANWKSNKNREEVDKWMDSFEEEIKPMVALNKLTHEIVVCPPMPSLMSVSNRLLNKQLFSQVSLGVQDISAYPAGSYTGGVSAPNLVGFNVRYAIVGHSERRKYFKENSQDVAMKIEQCLENEIVPIVCVDRHEVAAQASLIDATSRKRIIVAYEPIEHIGTGHSQPVDEVLTVFQEIKTAFGDVKIMYGGSVNPDNINQYLPHHEIQGFLVGSASLSVSTFINLISM